MVQIAEPNVPKVPWDPVVVHPTLGKRKKRKKSEKKSYKSQKNSTLLNLFVFFQRPVLCLMSYLSCIPTAKEVACFGELSIQALLR